MRLINLLAIVFLVSACNKSLNTTAWSISEPSKRQIKKQEKLAIKTQKKKCEEDSTLTFIKKDILLGTNQVSISEYFDFLKSYESLYGIDSIKPLLPEGFYIDLLNNDQVKSTAPIKKVPKNGALLFCKWKTDINSFQTFCEEGIIKIGKDSLRLLDNPGFCFKGWKLYDQKIQQESSDANCAYCGCNEYRKVRFEDELYTGAYHIADSTLIQELIRHFTFMDLSAVINDNKSTSNQHIFKNGFRYYFTPPVPVYFF